MHIKKFGLAPLFLLLPFFSTLHAQTESPSKFEMKKDGDGDGVKNKRDKCLSTPPGVAVDGTGCPVDTDKDGVADYLDKCPTTPGSAAMNGCQDKDNDMVNDKDDTCPDVPGLPRFRGCPDSDGDGIEDASDKCPNSAGSDLFKGCPDTDGDGVEDAMDKCPDTKRGVKADAQGCAADTDKDGIVDGDDRCPNTQQGVKVDASGCAADTDGDGVMDTDDKCPGVIGDATNNGCPTVKKEVPKRLQFAARKINFDTKNALVKSTSNSMLDELASIMADYPDYNLRISGHTDGIEKDPMVLSESRVDAVKSYLLSKGVPEARIVSAGYGKTRPMSTNVNAAGRAQNRRVMLELYLR
ncbi:MAG: OmpA family protein [Chitinophagaceae bacterium]|nr:OmpA family protein [Chitinophagaceae bacterium]